MDNVVSYDESKGVWIPHLIFFNNPGREILSFEGASLIQVKKKEKGKPTDLDSLHEDMIYSGTRNPLMMVTNLFMTFNCNFDLTFFPFDSQSCFAEVVHVLPCSIN